MASTKSPKNALFKINLLIQDAKEFKTNKLKRNQLLGLLTTHTIKCVEESCNCKKYLKILNERNMKILDKKLFEEKKKKTRISVDGEVTKNLKDPNHVISP